MSIKTHLRRIAVAAAFGLAAVGAQATVLFAQTSVGNFIFNVGAAVLPGTTTPLFANAAGQRFVVTFTAECAVAGPAGSFSAWTDVDIQVLNAVGAVVTTLPPTVGVTGSFCSSNSTPGLDGWSSNTVTAVGGTNLPAGNYRVRVVARLNNGATAASYGERTLVLMR